MAQAAARREEQEQARADILSRLLSADAKERLNRIALVKPDKVSYVRMSNECPSMR